MSPSATLQGALHGYERSLAWVMRHRPLALVFSAVILGLTVALWQVIPKGLFPPDDTGSLSGTTEAAQGTSFGEMVRLQQIAMERLEADTNIVSFTSSVRRWRRIDQSGQPQRHAQADRASARRPTRWLTS